MSTRSVETLQSLFTSAERVTRRASDTAERTFEERDGPASRPGGHDTSLGALEGKNATFPRFDETAHTRPQTDDGMETSVPFLKENGTAPSTPSAKVNSTTPLSQEDKTAERMYSSVECIETGVLPQAENELDSHEPEQDSRATFSQALVMAEPQGSIEDVSDCKHKVHCVPRYWR